MPSPETTDHHREWLKVAEIADELRCSARTIERHITDGSLASVRIGRLRRVSRAALDQFLAEREQWMSDLN